MKNTCNRQQPQERFLTPSPSKLSSIGRIFHNFVFYCFLVGLGFGLGIISYNLHRNYNRSTSSFIGVVVQKSLSPNSLPPGDPSPASAPAPSSPTAEHSGPPGPDPPSPSSPDLPPPPSPDPPSSVSKDARREEDLEGRGAFTVWHNMNDEELLAKASMAPRIPEVPSTGRPKVAFMFLVKEGLPLAPLWEKFFRCHGGLYSIYIHTSNQSYVDHTPPTSVFYGRRIPSKEVKWGENSMVEAERRLLANALLDPSNQRFVLLSESDIPLFNFTTVYNYLIHADRSFIQAYDKPGRNGRGRYNRRMLPTISESQWRKGSQWFEMHRDLAVEVVSDNTYFPVFEKHCNAACYSDEHYLPTFVSIRFPERNSNRTLTWTDWSRGGIHPLKYLRPMVDVQLLMRLREGDGKKCEYNGEMTSICYLFARKFDPRSLGRLLLFAPKVMRY